MPLDLDELLALQRDHDLGHVHLVDVGPKDFRLAHTDRERARGENTEACPMHVWLHSLDGPPEEPGIYVMLPHEPDAYSEPYGADPYDLEPCEWAWRG